jgi:hypothetical protein
MAEKGKSVASDIPDKFQFHYKKSKLFRVIHADGIIGNITPKNDIFVSFYNERMPLPDTVSHEIFPDGRLGKEILSERKFQTEGLLREMEVGVVIDVDFARSLVIWLTNVIQQTEGNDLDSKITKEEGDEIQKL